MFVADGVESPPPLLQADKHIENIEMINSLFILMLLWFYKHNVKVRGAALLRRPSRPTGYVLLPVAQCFEHTERYDNDLTSS